MCLWGASNIDFLEVKHPQLCHQHHHHRYHHQYQHHHHHYHDKPVAEVSLREYYLQGLLAAEKSQTAVTACNDGITHDDHHNLMMVIIIE